MRYTHARTTTKQNNNNNKTIKRLGFYGRWVGRGLWFLFLGALTFNNRTDSVGFWSGVVCWILAFLYIIFWFLPMIGSPTPVVKGGAGKESSPA